ncbi:MAG: hypothetical protein GYB35_16685 [Algicola sp.]|nr:hypothetical protein [Algicola sp.]
MNYKEIFAINNTHFNKLNNNNFNSELKFHLNNFDYYEPELIDDFYFKYFLRELLIEIDVLEVEGFISYHYYESLKKKTYLDVLEYKIIPKIKDVILRASVSMSEGGYGEIKLEDGFIKKDGIILKPNYEDEMIYHIVGWNKLHEDIKVREEMVFRFIQNNRSGSKKPKLTWSGKPAHLAYFVGQLIEENFIEPPRKADGDINQNQLSQLILNTFNFTRKIPSIETLKKYSNLDSEKFEKLDENFKKHDFHIPNSKLLE